MPIPERLNPVFAPVRSPAADRLGEARKRLIVALDVPDPATATALVDRLEDTCQWFKVGLELFVAAGPAVLEPLLKRGHSVFLDLKFNDIPNTVAGAVRSAAALGVRMMTVHASGGPAMLSAARTALEGLPDPPELLAVTVLTRTAGQNGSASRNSRLCLLSQGGCQPARAYGAKRSVGHSRHPPGRVRHRRPEAHCHARRGPAPGRQLPSRGPPHYPGA